MIIYHKVILKSPLKKQNFPTFKSPKKYKNPPQKTKNPQKYTKMLQSGFPPKKYKSPPKKTKITPKLQNDLKIEKISPAANWWHF